MNHIVNLSLVMIHNLGKTKYSPVLRISACVVNKNDSTPRVTLSSMGRSTKWRLPTAKLADTSDSPILNVLSLARSTVYHTLNSHFEIHRRQQNQGMNMIRSTRT